MPETAPQQDPLERQKNNAEAINIIMELYTVEEGVATDLWRRFIGTVEKMKLVVEERKS